MSDEGAWLGARATSDVAVVSWLAGFDDGDGPRAARARAQNYLTTHVLRWLMRRDASLLLFVKDASTFGPWTCVGLACRGCSGVYEPNQEHRWKVRDNLNYDHLYSSHS